MSRRMNQMNTVIEPLLLITLTIVDAFVALGGLPTKEGYISKNTLIEIIKTEFELTIDMEVFTFIMRNI
jgi:NADH:ubiquinone oxidoreductase subunit 5 (subunit L)/multisubunit Na+/H+ antiporter MnhA subunit